MKILIIEDEPLAARKLEKAIEMLRPGFTVLGIIPSVRESVEWFQANRAPDLLIMDIELSDGKSFELFQQVEINCPVIFVTAYDEYALKAFQVNSIDFLVKPFTEEELDKSLRKLEAFRAALYPPESLLSLLPFLESIRHGIKNTVIRERFLVKFGQRLITVEVNDIAFFYAEHKLVSLYSVSGKEYVIDYSLDQLEEMLSPEKFYRANRQYIISSGSIESIHTGYNGKYSVKLKTKALLEITVSREKAQSFKEWLGA